MDDPAVSRQHLQFYRKGDLIEVEDLGSANGSLLVRGSLSTLTDGEERELRLAPHSRITMGIGDSVRIGSTVLGLQLKTGLNQTRLKPGRSLTGPRVLVDPGMQHCYELVGRIRRRWKGFDGGEDAWTEIDAFFAEVRARSTEVNPETVVAE